jgi:hypothetical protein
MSILSVTGFFFISSFDSNPDIDVLVIWVSSPGWRVEGVEVEAKVETEASPSLSMIGFDADFIIRRYLWTVRDVIGQRELVKAAW